MYPLTDNQCPGFSRVLRMRDRALLLLLALSAERGSVDRDGRANLRGTRLTCRPGAHTQGATLDELKSNLRELLEMLLEDGEPRIESGFVGVQTVRVA